MNFVIILVLTHSMCYHIFKQSVPKYYMTALVKEYIHDLLFQKNFPTFNVSFFFSLSYKYSSKIYRVVWRWNGKNFGARKYLHLFPFPHCISFRCVLLLQIYLLKIFLYFRCGEGYDNTWAMSFKKVPRFASLGPLHWIWEAHFWKLDSVTCKVAENEEAFLFWIFEIFHR
jgi:hypothetical protein